LRRHVIELSRNKGRDGPTDLLVAGAAGGEEKYLSAAPGMKTNPNAKAQMSN
jgi:hypothetical protein